MNIKILIIALLTFFIFLTQQVQALEFIMTGRSDETYDDNINSSSDDPESDWVTNLMLGIAVNSEGKTHELELAGKIYQRYCLKHEDLNNFYQDLMLSVNKSFSENIIVLITDTFYNYPEAQSFGAMFDRSEASGRYTQNNFASSLTVFATNKLFLTGVYNNSIQENDSELISDSVLHNPGISAGYYFSTADIVRAGYMYSQMKYDDNTEARGDRSYAEYEKYFTKQLRLILHGGFDYTTTSAGEASNSRYMISLIDDVDKRNQIDITFLKDNTISSIINDTFNNWRISGTLAREVSNRTTVNMALFYGSGVYSVSRVRDKLGGASFSLAYAVSEFINFNTGYTFTWGSSEQPGSGEASFKRNQVYVGVSGEY